MTNIDRAHFYTTLANPVFAEPLRCLHSKKPFAADADEFSMARAGAALRVGTDALLTAGARQVVTAPVAVWRVTALALAQPGAAKAAVLPAPLLGLVGGVVLGAVGGTTDVLQAGWYVGVVAPTNVVVATTRRAYRACEQTIDDMWEQIHVFAEPPAAPEANSVVSASNEVTV